MCLAKGTMIDVVRGLVPIEDVKAGDDVFCYDENRELDIKKVVWSGRTGNKKVLRLHWSGGGNSGGYVDLTPEHMVRVEGGEYVKAMDLSNGQRVLAFGSGEILHRQFRTITGVLEINKCVDVYDLEIKDCHNFIANQICVHNSCSDPVQESNVLPAIKKVRWFFKPTNFGLNLHPDLDRVLYEVDMKIIRKVKSKIREVFKEYLDEELASVKLILWERVSIRDNKIHELGLEIEELKNKIEKLSGGCACKKGGE